MELDLLALQSGVVLGLTAVVGKFVPEKMRDQFLPVAALCMGVLAVFGTEGVTIMLAFKGIVLGGSVTGLYGVAKDMRKEPTVVIEK